MKNFMRFDIEGQLQVRTGADRYRRSHQRCGGQSSGRRLRFPVRCGRHRRHGHRGGCGVQRGHRQGRQLQDPASLRVRHQQERDPVGAGTGLCGLCHQQGRCRPHPHRRCCAGERVITGWFAWESSPVNRLPRI